MLEFCQVTKQYGKKRAVSDVSFVCADHAVTVLLGPNGAGKTTVLKAAAGIHDPTSGDIRIDGESAVGQPSLRSEKTAFVTELPVLPGHFTVKSYLKTLSNLYGNPDVDSCIRQCALEDVLSSKIRTLSKGYQQRVSFAAALLKNTGTVILDEPVSGLDPLQIVEMRSEIRRMAERRTVLLSTHLMQEAEVLADTIVIMYQGNIAAVGTKEQLIEQSGTSSLEEAYIALTEGMR